MTLFFWLVSVGFLASVLLLVGLMALIRSIYLATRIGSFRTLLSAAGPLKWRKGFARYGRFNLAWSPLVSLRVKPEFLLARTELEVIGEATLSLEEGTTILRLRCGGDEYELILSTGDYTGLVAWIESYPPSEAPL